jgi:lambda repressor-like predicted transcriptional regulator
MSLAETIVGSVGSQSAQAEDNPRTNTENRHKVAMQALLDKRGWTINDLAVQAGVDFHTADRFVKGSAKSYSSTRKKFADALGVGIEELPA